MPYKEEWKKYQTEVISFRKKRGPYKKKDFESDVHFEDRIKQKELEKEKRDFGGLMRHHIWWDNKMLEHKTYPKCNCGRYYVPIKKGDTKCFYCQFTKI